MKHLRSDYDRIQDPAGIIPPNEPVFLLRAQDILAPLAIREWARLWDMHRGDPYVSKRVRDLADEMVAWPIRKMPTIPTRLLRE